MSLSQFNATDANDDALVVIKGGTDNTSIGNTSDSLKTNVTNASGASAVNIQDGGNSITVDGTVAATQSGTWTVQPGNTANTTPWLATINQGGNSATVSAANALKVDGSAVTQPVSAASLPLPAGAATSANQTTEISSLSSIDTKLTTTNSSLSSIDAGIPTALGQTTMSASMPIVIASDQTALPITAATLPLPSGASTSANQTTEITSLQIIDDVPTSQNGTFVKGAPIMGQLDDTSTVAATEDAVATVRITAQRALHTNLHNNAGTEVGTSTTPLRIDPTGTTTQPISAVSLPLPTGAATETTLAKLPLSQGSTTSGQSGVLEQGAVTTAAPTYTTGQTSPLSLTTAGALRTDGSATTQPVSAANLPLPTGASTSALQTTGNSSLSSIDTKLTTTNSSLSSIDAGIPAALGQTTMAASMPVTISSDQSAIPVSGTITTSGDQTSSFSPDPSSYISGTTGLVFDASNNLQIRGQVFSDEGSFRDDFSGSALTTTLTGTITFTNGSAAITGSGTLFLTELVVGQYIKKSTDAETLYLIVDSIQSDTSITLEAAYAGTTASVAAVKSNWKTSITGGSITVGSSLVSLLSSTANANSVRIIRHGDYLPYNLLFKTSISQRIANQTSIIGFQDNPASVSKQAVFVFDGTTNTTVKCRSSFSGAASDIQETTVTLPSSAVTSASNTYQIDLTSNQVTFSINKIVLAIHQDHLPAPYDVMQIAAGITNAAVVTTTTLSLDYAYFANLDQLQITNDFTGEPIKAQLMGKSSTTGLPVDLNLDASGNLIVTALTGFNSNFSFGDITTAASATVPVRRTAYTEQTSNAQRSIASASANDTSVGTGARTVTITYLDSTGAGPYTEVLTLNGTTGVNTVATNICYVEKMAVTTVGSGNSNAGIITLYSAVAKGGVAVGTMAATDNQTFWNHHYVPINKICNITGVSSGHNGTTVGSGALFVIKALPIGVTNAVEVQVTDFIRLYGQSSTFSRNYTSPIKVNGPARMITYVSPETTSSTVYRSAVDFFEP